MYTEESMKIRLKTMCQEQPYIHINVSLVHPHVEMKHVRVRLVGVYKNIFLVEEEKDGKTVRYSFQYGDVSAGIVTIEELG